MKCVFLQTALISIYCLIFQCTFFFHNVKSSVRGLWWSCSSVWKLLLAAGEARNPSSGIPIITNERLMTSGENRERERRREKKSIDLAAVWWEAWRLVCTTLWGAYLDLQAVLCSNKYHVKLITFTLTSVCFWCVCLFGFEGKSCEKKKWVDRSSLKLQVSKKSFLFWGPGCHPVGVCSFVVSC